MNNSMEEKLDEDFLFYLTFTKPLYRNLIDKYDIEVCKAWLKRLCHDDSRGIAAKRSRNIYLSQLVLAMQEGKLWGPFLQPPSGHLSPPQNVFGPDDPPLLEPPAWLDNASQEPSSDMNRTSRDGRTYLAMRNLGQRGAFGCVAINTERPAPHWRYDGGADYASDPTTLAGDACKPCENSAITNARVASDTTSPVSPRVYRSVRLPGGGSLHDVSVRLAGGSDAVGAEELRFAPSRLGHRGAEAAPTRAPVAPQRPSTASEATPSQRPLSADKQGLLNELDSASLETEADDDFRYEVPVVPPSQPFLLDPRAAQAVSPRALPTPPGTASQRLLLTARPNVGRRQPDEGGRSTAIGSSGGRREGTWGYHDAPPSPALIDKSEQDHDPAPSSATATDRSSNGKYPSQRSVENMPPLQVLNNLRQMLATRPAPEDRTKVLELYQMLVKNVDAVWNGTAEPIPEVVNLLKKIHQGLKGVLPPPNTEQHIRTVLTILREKLVRRIAEVGERERKLENAENLLTKSPEEMSQTKFDIPSPLSDVLWNEAVNQTPKRQNLIKLQDMYDEALVEKFIELLANEKGKIIDKCKQQYENSVQYMKQKLQEKVSDAVNAYIIAREDWAEVSFILDNIQNTQVKTTLHATENVKQWQVISQLMDQIKESQEHYEKEIQRGEDLRMLLVAERQNCHLMKLIADNNLQQLQNDHSELCDTIHQMILEIKHQHSRIEELQYLLFQPQNI